MYIMITTHPDVLTATFHWNFADSGAENDLFLVEWCQDVTMTSCPMYCNWTAPIYLLPL